MIALTPSKHAWRITLVTALGLGAVHCSGDDTTTGETETGTSTSTTTTTSTTTGTSTTTTTTTTSSTTAVETTTGAVCDPGLVECGGSCVDLNADDDHCGACDNACDSVLHCVDGTCTLVCDRGAIQCGDACVDPNADPNNCGECGVTCDVGEQCIDGACTLVCEANETACNGACVDTEVDPNNCGMCGTTCDMGYLCTAGLCTLDCPVNEVDCDGMCANLDQDPMNCGGCGTTCLATEKCSAGVCTLDCQMGTVECDGLCVDTQTDPAHCGDCGTACDMDEICDAGACACGPGLTACGDACVDLQTDEMNCGGCGMVCDSQCTDGKCELLGNNYDASMTITDALQGTTMTIAWDGAEFWSCSGGGQGGVRYARYAANGTLQATYSPGIDFRSVFTKGDGIAPIFAREFNSANLRQQQSPGVFIASTTLTGGPLDAQSAVVWDAGASEFVAMNTGTVTRWSAAGAVLGTVALQGWGMNGENAYPQDRGIVATSGYYLTYANQIVSVWDKNGVRLDMATLNNAGTTFDSHFSFSYAQGKVWVVDAAGSTWRGYNIGL